MAMRGWLAGVAAALVFGSVVPVLALDAGAPRVPAPVGNPAGPPLAAQPGSAPARVFVPVDIGAVIEAWRRGEVLVNRTRSGVRYNQRPARLLFSCAAPFTLEVTPGEVVAGRPAAYDSGNTRACGAGEALYASAGHGLFCQAATPAGSMPRDPDLRAYSEIILDGSPALALLGVCVGRGDQVFPAQIGGGVATPALAGCEAPASGVRYNGQGKAGYATCPQ